jgi:hypothetical protein
MNVAIVKRLAAGTESFRVARHWRRVQTGAVVFVDIYFSSLETVPRADVEALLEDRLPPGCEIVGAGAGVTGSNIDPEIPDRTAVAVILDVLRSLGAKVRLEELP